MKRIVIAVALTLSLGGCATGSLGNLGTAISLATKSVTNPVTKAEEVQVELAIDAALAVLQGYKTACVQGSADKNCRANISAVQRYTRQMPPLIAQLRGFVDTNDQINAIVVYNQLTTLYANFKNTAGQLGYNIGALP